MLIEGEPTEDDLQLAAQITARFSSGRSAEQVNVETHRLDGTTLHSNVVPLHPDQIPQAWYV